MAMDSIRLDRWTLTIEVGSKLTKTRFSIRWGTWYSISELAGKIGKDSYEERLANDLTDSWSSDYLCNDLVAENLGYGVLRATLKNQRSICHVSPGPRVGLHMASISWKRTEVASYTVLSIVEISFNPKLRSSMIVIKQTFFSQTYGFHASSTQGLLTGFYV